MEHRQVLVVGAGIMGSGIAQIAALAGFEVALVDVSHEVLEKAMKSIQSNLDGGVKREKYTAEHAAESLKRIATSTDLAAQAATADLVIEAASEDIGLKLRIFAQLDRACAAGTILATNTSAKSITEIAAATGRPQQVVGMHFFNPPHIMRLVEVVRGLETTEETCAAVEEAARRMGKEPVRVNEAPGFVTSRINALIGNEAFYMLSEGVASARDIDRALKLGLNHPMGPFELADLVGLDVRLSVLEHLHSTLGEKYRPCPLLVRYVKAGRLGRKTGRGVYEYPADQPKR
jgi:3-hydroxybutyryl-CoA dehydrogenase